MPLIRELDSSAGPLNFFGAELRRWRMSAGLSQEQLGQRVGYSAAQVGKVETGDRAPSLDFAQRCDGALPDAGGLFGRIYQLARRWDGGYPSWFRDWLEAEREASSLRWWEPMLVPGLLQTPDYARAILGGRPDPMEDELEQMVAARIERQAVLDRPRPPTLWVVLDEVVPARVGAHAGLLGAFIIAGFSGALDIVYLETSADGQVSDKSSVVAQVTLRFDTLRAVALPRDDSRGLIVKVADGRWTP
jgi:transcriptional regulator with XRE-family HTH domain